MRPPTALAQLSKPSARLCLEVEKILLANFGKLPKFLLAISGGKDSTALAVIFNILAQRLNFELCAIHVDHQWRDDSHKDAMFVQELCGALNIRLHGVKFNLPRFARHLGCGVEEAGHLARRRLFLARAAEINAHAVVLAHHADDLAEDILLRLIRGVSWPALGGMAKKNGVIFRPFLSFPVSRILSFLERENIPWAEDSTNASDDYRRNRIRHNFLPLFLAENPGWHKSLVNLNRLAEMDEDYWRKELADFFGDITFKAESESVRIFTDREKFARAPQALRLRAYAYLIKQLCEKFAVKGQGRAETFFLLDAALTRGDVNKIFQFPGHIRVFLKKDFLVVVARVEK